MSANDIGGALVRLRSELAAEEVRAAILDLLEIKFDPNQPRAPVGSSNGGQWVNTGRGASGGRIRKLPRVQPKQGAPSLERPLAKLATPVVRAAVARPELATSAARAVGLPVVVGSAIMTRQIGAFDRAITGRAKTPFLNLPAGKLDLSITSGNFDDDDVPSYRRGRTYKIWSPEEKRRIADECDELEKSDLIACETYGAMYGRSAAQNKKIKAKCYESMNERQFQCRQGGGIDAVRTNLFMGRW